MRANSREYAILGVLAATLCAAGCPKAPSRCPDTGYNDGYAFAYDYAYALESASNTGAPPPSEQQLREKYFHGVSIADANQVFLDSDFTDLSCVTYNYEWAEGQRDGSNDALADLRVSHPEWFK